MKGSGEGEVRPFLGKTTSNPFQKVLDISPECLNYPFSLIKSSETARFLQLNRNGLGINPRISTLFLI